MLTHDALESIPGVGVKTAQDLRDLGYSRVSELAHEDPEKLYRDLCEMRGMHIDRCVLYVFRCAVYYASTPNPEPALLQWWNWKGEQR